MVRANSNERIKVPFLTLAIPTYNRRPKVKRLLDRLCEINATSQLGEEVEVLICDNASEDGTSDLVQEYRPLLPQLRCFKQERNVGFDRNVFKCYELAQGDYVWLHSDDDIPDLSSVDKILRTLRDHRPGVLRFSFRQPADAQVGAFNFAAEVHLEKSPAECVELVMRFPKVSTYVLRRMQFTSALDAYHNTTFGDGFSFVILGLSILADGRYCSTAVLSETLACCDPDYKTLDWPPNIILNSYRQAEHPFVRSHCPKLARTMKYESYMNAIDLAYQVASGSYQTTIPMSYASFGASVPYRLHYLLRRPKSLLRLWKLKRQAVNTAYETPSW